MSFLLLALLDREPERSVFDGVVPESSVSYLTVKVGRAGLGLADLIDVGIR